MALLVLFVKPGSREPASGELEGVRFRLPPGAWTLAGFRNDGSLFALLSPGRVEDKNGNLIFRADAPAALLALDHCDIRNSTQLELAALGAGDVELANSGIRRARWKKGNGPALSLRQSNRSITLSCDDDFVKGRIIVEK